MTYRDVPQNVMVMFVKAKKLRSLVVDDGGFHAVNKHAQALSRQSSSLQMIAAVEVSPPEARLLRQVSSTSFFTSGE